MAIHKRKLIILFMAFIIGIWLFFEPIPIYVIEEQKDKYVLEINLEEIEKPGIKNSLRKIFAAPFDFNNFNVYLEDKCPEKIIKNIEHRNVYFHFIADGSEIKLEQCSKTLFRTIKIDKKFTYPKTIEMKTSIPPGESKIFRKLNLRMTAEPDTYEVIPQVIIFCIAFLGVWLLIVEIVKYFRKKEFFPQ